MHPQHFIKEDPDDLMNPPQQLREHGLTKREYFAAIALQGLCAQGGYKSPETIAADAVDYADILLTKLEKKQ